MRALVFSDIHIHNYPSKEGNRLEKCIEVLYKIFAHASNLNIKKIFCSGDLYDQGKRLHPLVVDEVIECFRRNFKEFPDVVFYSISGNHDQASHNTILNPAETALSHLAAIFPNNFVLLDNRSIEIDDDTILHGVPYYVKVSDAREQISNRLKFVQDGKVNILLNHQHHPGCEFGSDFLLDDVRWFSFVFTGHIHRHMLYSYGMYSVGSPLWRDAADNGDDKGILLIDTEKETNQITRFVYEVCPIPERVIAPIANYSIDYNDSFVDISLEDILRKFIMDTYPGDDTGKHKLIEAGLKYIQ